MSEFQRGQVVRRQATQIEKTVESVEGVFDGSEWLNFTDGTSGSSDGWIVVGQAPSLPLPDHYECRVRYARLVQEWDKVSLALNEAPQEMRASDVPVGEDWFRFDSTTGTWTRYSLDGWDNHHDTRVIVKRIQREPTAAEKTKNYLTDLLDGPEGYAPEEIDKMVQEIDAFYSEDES